MLPKAAMERTRREKAIGALMRTKQPNDIEHRKQKQHPSPNVKQKRNAQTPKEKGQGRSPSGRVLRVGWKN